MATNLIVSKHRAKIGAQQEPSQETIEYAKSVNMHDLGPDPLAFSEWDVAGLERPDMDKIRTYRLERVRYCSL